VAKTLNTVKVVGGPKGTMIVNELELPAYRAKGYRLAGEAVLAEKEEAGTKKGAK
jgi:hypothetical protein